MLVNKEHTLGSLKVLGKNEFLGYWVIVLCTIVSSKSHIV